MDNNTKDLSKFGMRELAIAGELLVAYAEEGQGSEFLTDGVSVEFNPNSGMVFLVDGDFNVGVLEDDGSTSRLVQFFSCSECGAEGTAEDFANDLEHKLDGSVIEHLEDK